VSLTAELREARVRRVLQDWRRGVGFDPSPVSDRRTAAGWTWPKGYTGQRTERGEMLGDPPASDAMVGTS
jgi:hypothetical protein